MRIALLTMAAAATMTLAGTSAQASTGTQKLNLSYDALAPRSTNVAERNTTEPVELVNNRRGRRYYRGYPQRSYRPSYRSYRPYSYPSYRSYNRYPGPSYYRYGSPRYRYGNPYYGGGGIGVYGRNFSFGIGF